MPSLRPSHVPLRTRHPRLHLPLRPPNGISFASLPFPAPPHASSPASLLRRSVHIRATPATSALDPPLDLSAQTQSIPKLSGAGPFPASAQFEVLGAPYSLLSVSLPASTHLYSRRGALVGVNGKVENATSTLTFLSPLRRLTARIPFLYQKTSSTTPLTCLLSTASANTTFGVIELDGKADWNVAQRDALLAWTGHSISVVPRLNGGSHLSGRGLVALIGRGQIYQLTLTATESMLISPSSLLAYSSTSLSAPSLSSPADPVPYRIPASSLRLQIPKFPLSSTFSSLLARLFSPLTSRVSEMEWLRAVRASAAWRQLVWFVAAGRSWLRRSVWAEREFLRFVGPATVLLQSREVVARGWRDVVRRTEMEDVEEWARVDRADATEHGAREAGKQGEGKGEAKGEGKEAKEAMEGEKQKMLQRALPDELGEAGKQERQHIDGRLKKVLVGPGGKVEFQDSDFKEFVR